MDKGIYEGASGEVCILSWLQPGAQQLPGSPICPVIAQSGGSCRETGEKGVRVPSGQRSGPLYFLQEVPDLSLSRSLLRKSGTQSQSLPNSSTWNQLKECDGLAGFLVNADVFVQTVKHKKAEAPSISHPSPSCLCRRCPDGLKTPNLAQCLPFSKPERLSDLPKVSSRSEAELGPNPASKLLFFLHPVLVLLLGWSNKFPRAGTSQGPALVPGMSDSAEHHGRGLASRASASPHPPTSQASPSFHCTSEALVTEHPVGHHPAKTGG